MISKKWKETRERTIEVAVCRRRKGRRGNRTKFGFSPNFSFIQSSTDRRFFIPHSILRMPEKWPEMRPRFRFIGFSSCSSSSPPSQVRFAFTTTFNYGNFHFITRLPELGRLRKGAKVYFRVPIPISEFFQYMIPVMNETKDCFCFVWEIIFD